MNARRALIAAGLTTALLATAASPASATTISPTSVDFGRLLIGKRSAPKTFTVTVSSGERCRSPGPVGVDCYPIQPPAGGGFATGYNTLGFLNIPTGTCNQIRYLTPTTPSCTILVAFEPDAPGHLNGGVGPNDYDPLGAQLTGIGLLSKKAIWCRKGRINKKGLSRWCVNRQKK